MTKFCEDTAYFVQKLSDALCRGVLAGGYILKIVATGFQPHDFHLLFGNTFSKIVQKESCIQLLKHIVIYRQCFLQSYAIRLAIWI